MKPGGSDAPVAAGIGGVWPAALTMFDERGDIDEEACARHVDYLIRAGAHGIVAAGTSGEFIAMTEEERMRVVGVAVAAAARRVPVYAGTGHFSTRLSIELTQRAEALGADGAIVILPYYQRPPKPAVLEHYRALRRNTGLPLMLYNNPANSACVELSPRDVAALAGEGVIGSVKSTFESVAPVQDLLALCPGRLRVFYGSFHSPMEAMLAGAHGWISGFPNLLIRECVALHDACVSGDARRAREIWSKLLPFKQIYTLQTLGQVNDLAIYRSGLKLMGEHGGWSRLPFEPLDSAQEEGLARLMRENGVLQ